MSKHSNNYLIIIFIANLYIGVAIIIKDILWFYLAILWLLISIFSYTLERKLFKLDCKIERLKIKLEDERWKTLFKGQNLINLKLNTIMEKWKNKNKDGSKKEN